MQRPCEGSDGVNLVAMYLGTWDLTPGGVSWFFFINVWNFSILPNSLTTVSNFPLTIPFPLEGLDTDMQSCGFVSASGEQVLALRTPTNVCYLSQVASTSRPHHPVALVIGWECGQEGGCGQLSISLAEWLAAFKVG